MAWIVSMSYRAFGHILMKWKWNVNTPRFRSQSNHARVPSWLIPPLHESGYSHSSSEIKCHFCTYNTILLMHCIAFLFLVTPIHSFSYSAHATDLKVVVSANCNLIACSISLTLFLLHLYYPMCCKLDKQISIPCVNIPIATKLQPSQYRSAYFSCHHVGFVYFCG